ncbi:MAG: PocR ligand-binding domain-containing protein [Clostridium sp.]|nr:PocR ligand-binding domain-containing protein [Clostridium sp.]
MNILFHNDELLRLLDNLYTLTGIRANIYDFSGRDICLTDQHVSFCSKINACPEGHARCLACDAQAVRHCDERDSIYFYRCHAGICEAVIPIFSDGTPMAYLAFGQHLDNSDINKQWERTRATLGWYPGGPDALKEDFFSFRQYSPQEISACAEILKALASYIHLAGMIQTTEYTDLQRLEIYLDRHYMEKLSLASISSDLGISRTKLCSLAKRLSGGKTLSQMIAERRVAAAKLQLMKSDKPISAVAESVGITDYNYFTKIFRSLTNTTPSAFRKQYRHNIEIPSK